MALNTLFNFSALYFANFSSFCWLFSQTVFKLRRNTWLNYLLNKRCICACWLPGFWISFTTGVSRKCIANKLRDGTILLSVSEADSKRTSVCPVTEECLIFIWMSNFDLSVKLFPQLGRLHRDKMWLISDREMCLQIIQPRLSPNFVDAPDELKYLFSGRLMWKNCR